MKQVTIENVKKRIARIENGESVMRPSGMGLSMQHEFELACLRELVAVTEQLHAVVAENAALKSKGRELLGEACAVYAKLNKLIDPEIGDFIDGQTLHEFQFVLDVESPATDAAIAALRAESRKEGAIFAANRMLAAWDAGFVEDTPENAADIARAILSMTDFMDDAPEGDFDRSFADEILADIAAQLRQSVQVKGVQS